MSESEVGDSRLQPLVIGLVLAPIIGGLLAVYAVVTLAFAYQLLVMGKGSTSLGFAFPFATGAALQVSVTMGLPISFLIGLPAHLLLKRQGLRGWLIYAGVGAVAAMAGAMLASIVIGRDIPWLTSTWMQALAALAGAFAALTFWLIRRPDRDRKTTS